MDIDPQADRLVFFFSDKRNPHEVLPVFRPRFAITIWYFDQAEKLKALEEKRRREEGTERQTSSPDKPCPKCGHSSDMESRSSSRNVSPMELGSGQELNQAIDGAKPLPTTTQTTTTSMLRTKKLRSRSPSVDSSSSSSSSLEGGEVVGMHRRSDDYEI